MLGCFIKLIPALDNDMMEVSPTEYEVIVIGTGLAESIIAAACSRVIKHYHISQESAIKNYLEPLVLSKGFNSWTCRVKYGVYELCF